MGTRRIFKQPTRWVLPSRSHSYLDLYERFPSIWHWRRRPTSYICRSETTDSSFRTPNPKFRWIWKQTKMVCFPSSSSSSPSCWSSYSDVTSSLTQGRVICRLVSMFDFVEVLVDESDRRRAIATDIAEDHDDNTLESVIPIINHSRTDNIDSQDRTFRGYELLVQNVSNIEEKLLLMDLDELGVYFREVSSPFPL